jgi:hypothetical protein
MMGGDFALSFVINSYFKMIGNKTLDTNLADS